jgi:hypothetical protein
MAVEPDYRPVNMPKDYVTVPMPAEPGHAEAAGQIEGAAPPPPGEPDSGRSLADG